MPPEATTEQFFGAQGLGIFDPSQQEGDVEALLCGVSRTATHMTLDGSVVLGA